jgi:hypothetical protein
MDIVQIMRSMAKGERTTLGDCWSPTWCDNAADEIERLRAALAAREPDGAQPVAVPDGFVMVPVEPTKAMLTAGIAEFCGPRHSIEGAYRAMLAAAKPAGGG